VLLPPTTLPTAPPHHRHEEPAKRQPAAAHNMEKTRTRHEMAVKGSRARTRRWAYQVRPSPFLFVTVFDTQPSKFSCSRPFLARKARWRGFFFYYIYLHIIIISGDYPPPSLETRDGGVFSPQQAVSTMPKLAPPAQPIRQTRKTCQQACFTCSLHSSNM
jgi:hypothetical protein